MSYQFTNTKISNFQEMVGQALLDGSFQQLDGEKQMDLFFKGYEGQPQKLINLAQNLGPGVKKGLIKFNPQELADKAAALIPQKKNQRNDNNNQQPQQVQKQAVVKQNSYQPQTAAANDVAVGFNPMNFVDSNGQPSSNDGIVPLSQLNPANRVINGATNTPLKENRPRQLPAKRVNWPKGFETMEQGAKCDVLRGMINAQVITPIDNTIFNGVNNVAGMKNVLSTYFTLIPGAHPSFDEIQMKALGMLVTSPKLEFEMKKYGCSDSVSEPRFLEVNIEDYASNLADRFDFAFLLKTNDKNKAVLTLLDSVPRYDEKSRKWYISTSIQEVSFGKNRRNPFFPKKKLNPDNNQNLLRAPIGEIIDTTATETTASK